MSAYTRRKAKFKYKDRIQLERASQQQSNGTKKTAHDRVEQCRQRKVMNAAERINEAAGSASPQSFKGSSSKLVSKINHISQPKLVLIALIIKLGSLDVVLAFDSVLFAPTSSGVSAGLWPDLNR
ncbi:hypothetical protein ACJJTC_010664 [Scirpophaga incertulas]